MREDGDQLLRPDATALLDGIAADLFGEAGFADADIAEQEGALGTALGVEEGKR